MKKLIIPLLFLSINSFAQKDKSMMNISVFGGSSYKIGIESSYTNSKNLLFGVGFSINYTTQGKGVQLNIPTTIFSSGTYEIINTNTFSAYLQFGQRLSKNFTIISNFGCFQNVTIYNKLDYAYFLSPDGYYYILEDNGFKLLLGVTGLYTIKNRFSILGGYDNMNRFKGGIGYCF